MVIHVGSANLSIKVRKNSNSFVFLSLNGHANEAITKHIDMLTHDSVIFSSTVILPLPPRMGLIRIGVCKVCQPAFFGFLALQHCFESLVFKQILKGILRPCHKFIPFFGKLRWVVLLKINAVLVSLSVVNPPPCFIYLAF